jgi:hypothetical protein
MLNKIPSCRHALQPNSNKTSVKSRLTEPFTMVEDSIDAHLLRGGVERTYRKLKRLIRLCGGECDWPKRRIAAHLGMKLGTYDDHRRDLERSGLIVIERRRQKGCRQNDTNILRLSVGGLKIQPQKRTEKIFKPTTPARENPRTESIPPAEPQPSPTRQQWEARRSQDSEDRHRMRERYDTVGRALLDEKQRAREENRRWWREGERHRWDGGKAHRLARAEERTRRESEKCVGVYRGEVIPMSDDEVQQLRAKLGLSAVMEA